MGTLKGFISSWKLILLRVETVKSSLKNAMAEWAAHAACSPGDAILAIHLGYTIPRYVFPVVVQRAGPLLCSNHHHFKTSIRWTTLPVAMRLKKVIFSAKQFRASSVTRSLPLPTHGRFRFRHGSTVCLFLTLSVVVGGFVGRGTSGRPCASIARFLSSRFILLFVRCEEIMILFSSRE